MAEISSAYSFRTTLRLTFSDGVISPVASLKSRGRTRNTLIASAADTALLASSMAAWTSVRRSGSLRSDPAVASAGLPCCSFHFGSASSSRVTSAPMNFCPSPTTMHWLTRGWLRTRSSSTAAGAWRGWAAGLYAGAGGGVALAHGGHEDLPLPAGAPRVPVAPRGARVAGGDPGGAPGGGGGGGRVVQVRGARDSEALACDNE